MIRVFSYSKLFQLKKNILQQIYPQTAEIPIAGHTGWVQCISTDMDDTHFYTGTTDRTIKIWDMNTLQLQLTLTGHTFPVRGIVSSDR
ncbi:MAG: hypothetical protein EZS28_044593, partial [Streblomastix strix]